MRIWHYKTIQHLPKSQLIAQWRELNSIYKKQDDHILINYIYNYSKQYLYDYSQLVIEEIQKRGYRIKKWDNYNEYFENVDYHYSLGLNYDEHDNEYLKICYFNLYEKYLRGQKDFSKEQFDRLKEFVEKELGEQL